MEPEDSHASPTRTIAGWLALGLTVFAWFWFTGIWLALKDAIGEQGRGDRIETITLVIADPVAFLIFAIALLRRRSLWYGDLALIAALVATIGPIAVS